MITIFSSKFAFVYIDHISNSDTFQLGSNNLKANLWKHYNDYNYDTSKGVLGVIFNEQTNSITEEMNFITERGFLWVLIEGEDFNQKNYTSVEELFNKYMGKYMVTSKKILSSLFLEDFSDNLLEISIERQNYYEVLSSDLYYGSQLNYSSEFEFIINKDDVEIMSFKLQPSNSDSTITFINENLIQFRQYRHETEMKNQISALSALFNKTIKG